ncbi:hypothetical protein RIX33_001511 [Vibrio vulnificus]|nr:hypothetical protein [Vibrio vulnificus]
MRKVIVIGEMEPSLAINLSRAYSDKYSIVLVTQYISSFLYLYFLSMFRRNVKVHICLPKRKKKLSFSDQSFEYSDKVALFYKSLLTDINDETIKAEICSVWEKLSSISNRINIESVVIWNYSNAINSFLRYHCQNKGIKLNVIENGFFRPNTITLDYNGLNVDSRFYLTGEGIQEKNKYNVNCSFGLVSVKSYIYFRVFELISMSKINGAHFPLSLLYLLRRKKSHSQRMQHIDSKYDLDFGPYYFLPLQLLTDSQNVFYANFQSHEEVINSAIGLIGSDKTLVVKPHPLDFGINLDELRNRFGNSKIFFTDEDTETLLVNSICVICVNSTVGFEALCCGKNVHLLGQAMYQDLIGVYCGEQKYTVEHFRKSTQVDFNVNDYSFCDVKRLISYFN